ncbi:hypothetical protein L596_000530 [Steinernema carpocapsae]|uniref:Uncharacterized protein n=1 Tax=Steinernema carpocapsae TaxID=34508 RepID=A0A4U8UKT3_STECR|nr:hypothetical protein L596_000530 [Steinernema carpocapsae]
MSGTSHPSPSSFPSAQFRRTCVVGESVLERAWKEHSCRAVAVFHMTLLVLYMIFKVKIAITQPIVFRVKLEQFPNPKERRPP